MTRGHSSRVRIATGSDKAWRGIDRCPVFFRDLVTDTLIDKFQDYDFQTSTYRIYTTLDLHLQRDATEAVRIGMEEVDKQLKPRHKKDPNFPDPQCALVALDPQTGEVKAFIGGRNYGASQLDRVLAKRQPGVVFQAVRICGRIEYWPSSAARVRS